MADSHSNHTVNYGAIFIALVVCTLISCLFDVIDLKHRLMLICFVLSVAVAKALFVLTYFMHLKFEGKWKFVLLAPTAILAMGLPLALLPDIGVHYYTLSVPQTDEVAGASHHEGDAQHSDDAHPEAGEESPSEPAH